MGNEADAPGNHGIILDVNVVSQIQVNGVADVTIGTNAQVLKRAARVGVLGNVVQQESVLYCGTSADGGAVSLQQGHGN
jgi:hypothetical protein